MVASTCYRRIAVLGLTLATTSNLLGTADASTRLRQGLVSRSVEETSSSSSFNGEEEDDAGEDPPLVLPNEESLVEQQFSIDPYANHNPMEMIQSGLCKLSSIRMEHTSFATPDSVTEDGIYTDVYGEFCVYDATLNKRDPAAFPSIDSVMSQSDHCGEHRYVLNLQDVMAAVNSHDGDDGSSIMTRLPVSGLLFHEGYAGANLITNALASTFDNTLVISEHSAIRDALSACDDIRNRFNGEKSSCSSLKQQALVQDVITLLSRTTSDSGLHHMYLKLSSGSSAYLHQLREVNPEAPWLFVYRDAETALAKATQRTRKSSCIKTRRNPSSALVKNAAKKKVDLEELTNEEVCALHLSTLVDAAFNEYQESGTGLLISYDDTLGVNPQKKVVDAIVDEILPYLGLAEEIGANHEGVQESVSNVISVRSNAGNKNPQADKLWSGKEAMA